MTLDLWTKEPTNTLGPQAFLHPSTHAQSLPQHPRESLELCLPGAGKAGEGKLRSFDGSGPPNWLTCHHLTMSSAVVT